MMYRYTRKYRCDSDVHIPTEDQTDRHHMTYRYTKYRCDSDVHIPTEYLTDTT